ncbi:MAG: lipoyl synthase [Candidatus Omnitrophica bacterium]|nr:lipoyl synthase [Candidatus Omnitrophota bacterium]
MTPDKGPLLEVAPCSAGGRRETRFPAWLRRSLGVTAQWQATKDTLAALQVSTICEEARCPNLGECWSHGNVSIMILGEACTRRCGFCAVTTARPAPPDPDEPARVAAAIRQLGLQYVVLTAPARDDLPDEGAGQFVAAIRAIRAQTPAVGVEVLIPDFHAREPLLTQVAAAGPDVISHNLETVRRLSPAVRPQAQYERSLTVLRQARRLATGRAQIKSGFMVGLGETPEEVRALMGDLRDAGCDLLTIGQYLQPTRDQRPVAAFIAPGQFAEYRRWGMALGFRHVASGPYVRSSYNAFEALRGGCL